MVTGARLLPPPSDPDPDGAAAVQELMIAAEEFGLIAGGHAALPHDSNGRP
ncbi:MAG TPA: hypothetical protein VG126_05090 [Thermoleophilaceae bacterium]|nr:hypothetical protein [Thermoleophilaceae bacterium]